MTGWSVWARASWPGLRGHPGVRDIATPMLRRLAEEVGATAHLTVADRGAAEAIAIAVVEPSGTTMHG